MHVFISTLFSLSLCIVNYDSEHMSQSRQARVFAEKRSTMSLSALRETMVVPRPRAWEDLWSRALEVQVVLEMSRGLSI